MVEHRYKNGPSILPRILLTALAQPSLRYIIEEIEESEQVSGQLLRLLGEKEFIVFIVAYQVIPTLNFVSVILVIFEDYLSRPLRKLLCHRLEQNEGCSARDIPSPTKDTGRRRANTLNI
jgi:hypothetical protein